MAKTGLSFDVAGALKGIDAFAVQLKGHLPRSMAVAGGQVVRDEAKKRAPKQSGLLASSIYVAYADKRSQPKDGLAIYSVAWNAKTAPHGHLIEFGHWRYNKQAENGRYMKSKRPGVRRGKGAQDHSGPGALEKPVWVPANPFMRPAYDAIAQTSVQAMLDRGQVRLAEIMKAVADGKDWTAKDSA
ncbi:HK97 gp10 family phage protein [Lampropedia aestuarii]|uniref:HK97 gp10 family phage protein n=1 Tax=Lampropedia aestuarii TaxID=2562762 RepID=A0A4S5BJ59_9BURK|nr:HK97 gp10 family phage protein [Lampropedia aestuarii]THJ30943.1 HK97 gp10 family phage protein [Lampropedia aestuarii]